MHRSPHSKEVGPPKANIEKPSVTRPIRVPLENSSSCLSFSRGCGKNQDEFK